MHSRRDSQRPPVLAPLAKLVLLLLAALALAGVAPLRAQAQVRIPNEAVAEEGGLQQVVQQGQELELQRRWGEALAFYENAVKDFPERSILWERMTCVRMHYDICRRYQDASFKNTLRSYSERQALDIYGEVLQKIESNYVKQPNWQDLARRGVDCLTTALGEASFREQHLVGVPEATVTSFRDELLRRMNVTVVRSRQDAREVAAVVARLTASQLGMRPAATILEFTCGATCALDQYSTFLTAAELEDVFSQIEGNFVGLGIELKAQGTALAIVSVIPGGPAEQAGIRKGDRIVEVDGVSTSNVSTEEAANLLKGVEGSIAQLVLSDAAGTVHHVRVTRRRVEVPSITDAKIADRDYGIAYLRLNSFQKTTARDLDAVLWKLYREGMQTLIVDVRANPGGLLTASVEVADRFLDAGNIVSTRGRSPREDFDYRAHSPGTWRVPLFVLVDGDTASASEIFAGAIRDHHRGTVVGQRSYGKGSVQGIFPLDNSTGGLRLTTAKFFSPSGAPISDRGVAPDLLVRVAKKPVLGGSSADDSNAEDAVLAAALQAARTALAQRQTAAQ
jgi:carboxyl-terminal processing protease